MDVSYSADQGNASQLPLPDFLRVRQGEIPMPVPNPINHLREPIDRENEDITPLANASKDGDIPRALSDQSESDTMGKSSGGDQPLDNAASRNGESSSDVSETSETYLSGWDGPVPPPQ